MQISDSPFPLLDLMRGFPFPWCVAGGWAIDLFLDRVTRSHADLELALFRQDQLLLHREFPEWSFGKVADGKLVDWPSDEFLTLPVHEIHARSRIDPKIALEFLLNERAGEDWIYRRDPRVRCPLDRAIQIARCGLPILNPVIVLLFKSKQPRGKDEADFHAARAALNDVDRQWLHTAFRMIDPSHPWLISLTN